MRQSSFLVIFGGSSRASAEDNSMHRINFLVHVRRGAHNPSHTKECFAQLMNARRNLTDSNYTPGYVLRLVKVLINVTHDIATSASGWV